MTAQEAVKVLREQFGKGRLAITLYPLHGDGARIHVEGESIADAVTVAPDAPPSLAQRARDLLPPRDPERGGDWFHGISRSEDLKKFIIELAERVDEHERLLKDSPLHPETKWNRFTKEDREWAESKLLEGLQNALFTAVRDVVTCKPDATGRSLRQRSARRTSARATTGGASMGEAMIDRAETKVTSGKDKRIWATQDPEILIGLTPENIEALVAGEVLFFGTPVARVKVVNREKFSDLVVVKGKKKDQS